MKTVILALLVLVVVSQGEALKCNCGGSLKICSGPVETCRGSNEVCASLIFVIGYDVNTIQCCMDANGCRSLSSQAKYAHCCDEDLCNS